MVSKTLISFFTAFTLAEVLIVLGIIGLIADMTIPTLVKSYQKQVTIVQFQKAYSSLSQVIKMSEVDNGPSSEWNNQNLNSTKVREYFKTYFEPYLKIQKECETYQDCGYKKYYFDCFNKNYSDTSNVVLNNKSRITVILHDGSIFQSSGYSATANGPVHIDRMYIDLNGAKAPNQYGKDVFRFLISPDGKGLAPVGIDEEDDIIEEVCKTNGGYCSAKIIKDGFKINYW